MGAIVATDAGRSTAPSLFGIQQRATMFIGAGTPVYEGQVVGESRRAGDLNVNVVRPKQLTNVRAAGKDEAAVLTPHRELEIEWGLEWRLRKRILPRNLRKRRSGR